MNSTHLALEGLRKIFTIFSNFAITDANIGIVPVEFLTDCDVTRHVEDYKERANTYKATYQSTKYTKLY